MYDWIMNMQKTDNKFYPQTPEEKTKIQKFFNGMLENRLKENNRRQLEELEKEKDTPKQGEDESTPKQDEDESTPDQKENEVTLCPTNTRGPPRRPNDIKWGMEDTADLVHRYFQVNTSELEEVENNPQKEKAVTKIVSKIYDKMREENYLMTQFRGAWMYRYDADKLKEKQDEKILEIKSARTENRDAKNLTEEEQNELNDFMYNRVQKVKRRVRSDIRYRILEILHARAHPVIEKPETNNNKKKRKTENENFYIAGVPLVLVKKQKSLKTNRKKGAGGNKRPKEKPEMVSFWGVDVKKKYHGYLENLNGE